MNGFHPLVGDWFRERFPSGPTSVQLAAWPTIEEGRDALVCAPTGSGKTLAAFLFCLDRLVRSVAAGTLEDRTYVLYVSPLKALSNDVQKNLEAPARAIAELAASRGVALPDLRIAVRTGDTSARERRLAAKRPPHVLVTTPESLFILLTSETGRRALGRVSTVIIDEIHAIAAQKRGAHLSLSIERLEHLVRSGGAPRPQRLGLSATVRPIELAARLLSGASGRELPAIVDMGRPRALDLAIEVLEDELGAVATAEQWNELYDRIAEQARAHRSTLVFVNTRRLVERVTHHLAARLGEDAVAAHHGSLSRARRFEAERRLKQGELKVVVATASLELGIDIGSVDLACLVGSPRSIGTALQRIGRSGHVAGATPKGRLFPLTRDQLVECAAIVRAARGGQMDAIAVPKAPLDVLAQQIVAMTACEAWNEDELFGLVRRAYPYADLERGDFDAVVAMLSEGIATRRGRAGALVHRDGVGRRLKGRRGARLAAITSGGAIPDNANYDVVLEPDGVKIGTLDEDFAIESLIGDVFLLGNSSWRVRHVENGVVRVEDAKGLAPNVPFWLGEAPARTPELCAEVGALRRAIAERLDDPRCVDWLMAECALDRRGAELARDYVAAAAAELGAIPSDTTIVAERFFDEAGGMQLVLHAPFGGRINRAFGLALRKRFCRMFDFELQAAATDDGVLLSLGPEHSFPLESIFELLRPGATREILVQAALQAPMFRTRWRWNASRALAVLRFSGGRRVPPNLLRMRSDDLLAAVFPAQVACQDNHGVGALIEVPDHPLVAETVRDCLHEAMDADGLERLLSAIATGAIKTIARETPSPSVLSHEILNANPYAFLDDAPLEERRARAVSVRRGLPAEVADRIGGLDADAIAEVVQEARPDVRDPDELHDLLLDLVVVPENAPEVAGFGGYFDELARAGRAALGTSVRPRVRWWVAAERRPQVEELAPAARFDPDVCAPARLARPSPPLADGSASAMPDQDGALAAAVRGWMSIVGPTTARSLALRLGLEPDDVDRALLLLEGAGMVLRGRFSPDLPQGELEWCDRVLLARIHRRTVHRARAEIEPVTATELMRFLLGWQHVRPGLQLHGREGLARVVAQLQGFELAAAAWERDVLPARIAEYDPSWLDELCLSGELVWGRFSQREPASAAPGEPAQTRAPSRSAPSRASPITLARRRDLAWLLVPRADQGEARLSHAAGDVLAYLERAGASFLDEIIAGARRLPSEVEESLWELVAVGRLTADGFAGLRALLVPASKRSRGNPGRPGHARRARAPLAAAGRWSLLRPPPTAPARLLREVGEPGSDSERRAGDEHDEARVEAWARQYVRRYGVVFRDLLAREPGAPSWRDLLRVYRRLEMRGELRGGRLVGGFVGEQFAAPEAVDALRAARREPPSDEVIRLSACDPLNLIGIVTPGPRVAAHLGNEVYFRHGSPLPLEEGRALYAQQVQARARLHGGAGAGAVRELKRAIGPAR